MPFRVRDLEMDVLGRGRRLESIEVVWAEWLKDPLSVESWVYRFCWSLSLWGVMLVSHAAYVLF